MSLPFFQSSRYRSQPIHLFHVVYGTGPSNQLFMTDNEKPISWMGNTWSVYQIKSTEISASGTLDKATVELRAPFTNPLTELFRMAPPDSVVVVTIYRGDANDPDQDYRSIWRGRVLGFSIEGVESRFACDPIGTSVKRPGLRRNFQYSCPHVLYGPSCRANRGAATQNTTLAAAPSGMQITVQLGWNGSRPTDKFQGGIATWTDPTGNTVSRTILQVSGGGGVNLLLSGLPTGLAIGSAVALSLGCNHQTSDCSALFANIPNYGGQPYIPTRNPVGNSNNFY